MQNAESSPALYCGFVFQFSLIISFLPVITSIYAKGRWKKQKGRKVDINDTKIYNNNTNKM